MSYDPRFLEGIRKFNQREFFEAHQIWERIWLEDRSPFRDFYKGLIQVALCLHHFNAGNTRGARKLHISYPRYLNGLRPRHQGVDLDALLSKLESCCAELMASQEETPRVQLQAERIPVMDWQPPTPTSGD